MYRAGPLSAFTCNEKCRNFNDMRWRRRDRSWSRFIVSLNLVEVENCIMLQNSTLQPPHCEPNLTVRVSTIRPIGPMRPVAGGWTSVRKEGAVRLIQLDQEQKSCRSRRAEVLKDESSVEGA